MPLEFPAVSQSRIGFWKQPQYTQKGMLLFTILFGFLGLHHFYLRSPQTGLMILLANVFTLGYPYFFDIVQLATKSHEELQTKGLDLPWSPAGIAQGMWIDSKDIKQETAVKGAMMNQLKRFGESFSKQEGGGDATSPPAPHWFLFYSLLLPIAPLARYAAGDTDNAILGLLNLTIIPLGFLFYAVSIVSEYWTLFMKPNELLTNGIYRAFPFTRFGYSETGYSPRLTGHIAEETVCEDQFVLIRMFKAFYRSLLPAWLVSAIDTVPPTVEKVKTDVIDRGVEIAQNVQQKVGTVVQTAGKVATLAAEVPQAFAAAQQQIQTTLQKATTLPIAPTLESLQQPQPSSNVKQTGGGVGSFSSMTTTDKAVTGGLLALVLGGFVLHTGRSFWNAIQDVRSATDLPPRPSAYT